MRRLLRFDAGVAANLMGLAYVAAEQGRSIEVAVILREAELLALTSDSAAVTAHIEEARRHPTH